VSRAGLLCRLGACLAVRGQDGGDGQYAGNGVHRVFRGFPRRFHCCAFLRRHFDGETDIAVLYDDTGNHAQRDDVPAALRFDNMLERVENLLLAHLRHA
jgi:hypothetical protein